MSDKSVLYFYDAIYEAVKEVALSKELNPNYNSKQFHINQNCLSTTMVFIYKYLVYLSKNSMKEINDILEIIQNNHFSSLHEIDSQITKSTCSKSDFETDKNIHDPSVVNIIEIIYLSAFFLATKTTNCITSVTSISEFIFNKKNQNVNIDTKNDRKESKITNFKLETINCFTFSFNKDPIFEKSKSNFKAVVEDKIKQMEFDILCTIGFDLNVDLPYVYLSQMNNYFKTYIPRCKEVMTFISNFINDSFRVPICLYYSPLKITLAAIFLTHEFIKIPLVDTLDNIKWYNIIDDSVTLTEIKEVASLINLVFTKNNKSLIPNNVKYISVKDNYSELNNINKMTSKLSDLSKIDEQNKQDGIILMLGNKREHFEV